MKSSEIKVKIAATYKSENKIKNKNAVNPRPQPPRHSTPTTNTRRPPTKKMKVR